MPPIDTHGISFALLLNLTSVCNPDDKDVLWGFISQYAPEATPANSPYLDHMTEFAINYYNDFIKANKTYLTPNIEQKEMFNQIIQMLQGLNGEESGEEIQNKLYAIGMEISPENLRGFFKEIYQILLGQEQGPRLGTFFKLYGIEATIKLINSKIND